MRWQDIICNKSLSWGDRQLCTSEEDDDPIEKKCIGKIIIILLNNFSIIHSWPHHRYLKFLEIKIRGLKISKCICFFGMKKPTFGRIWKFIGFYIFNFEDENIFIYHWIILRNFFLHQIIFFKLFIMNGNWQGRTTAYVLKKIDFDL